eukprot:5218685-Amphidinium_carterae.2
MGLGLAGTFFGSQSLCGTHFFHISYCRSLFSPIFSSVERCNSLAAEISKDLYSICVAISIMPGWGSNKKICVLLGALG